MRIDLILQLNVIGFVILHRCVIFVLYVYHTSYERNKFLFRYVEYCEITLFSVFTLRSMLLRTVRRKIGRAKSFSSEINWSSYVYKEFEHNIWIFSGSSVVRRRYRMHETKKKRISAVWVIACDIGSEKVYTGHIYGLKCGYTILYTEGYFWELFDKICILR